MPDDKVKVKPYERKKPKTTSKKRRELPTPKKDGQGVEIVGGRPRSQVENGVSIESGANPQHGSRTAKQSGVRIESTPR